MTDLVRADGWRGFRQLVAELGGDPDGYARAVGIDPNVFSNPDTYVPFSGLVRALNQASKDFSLSDFGLRLGLLEPLDMLGPLNVAQVNCETARQSLECSARFAHVHNMAARLSLEPLSDDRVLISQDFVLPNPPPLMQQNERVLAFRHRNLARLCGPAYRPIEVRVQHAPLSPLSVYRAAFGITPIFDARRTGVVVAREILDQRRPDRSEHLLRLAMRFLESAAPSDASSLADRVRAALAAIIRSGAGAQAEVARALVMHERTLQRRLRAEGASFEGIRDEVRRDLALVYLRQPGIPLSRISELLSYSEPAAFTRSCRRWFGETPRQVRRRLCAGLDA